MASKATSKAEDKIDDPFASGNDADNANKTADELEQVTTTDTTNSQTEDYSKLTVAGKAAAILAHEEQQAKKYKQYKVEVKKYNDMQKKLKEMGSINTGALIEQMENAATPTNYHVALKKWNEIQEVYNSSGCVPPPPPAILHVERPSIELQCHKGYKIGWDEARTWTELIWEDLKKPNSTDGDKLTLWKDKISHYTRCLTMWFSSKHQVFHICAKRGILEGIDHFVELFFVKGIEAVKQWKENKNKSNDAVTVWKEKYNNLVKKKEPEWCQKHYAMNSLQIATRPDLMGACGPTAETDKFPGGLYCANRDMPVCD